MTPQRHLPALDGSRGVAIIMVVWFHCGHGWADASAITRNEYDQHSGLTLPALLDHILGSGSNGVMLFFVVSAFTLTLRYGDGPQDWPRYALRRVARIGPAYWLAALLYTAWSAGQPKYFAPDGVSFVDFAIAAVFGSAWTGGPPLAVVPGGWSVAVEASFYLALPFLVVAVRGQVWRAVLVTAVVTAIVNARGIQRWDSGAWDFAFYVSPIQQAPCFLFGFLAAVLFRRFTIPPMRRLVTVALLIAVFWLPLREQGFAFLLQYLSFAALAAVAVLFAAIQPPAFLSARWLRTVGKLSFSIYLVHFAILAPSLVVALRLFPAANWATLVVYTLLTLAGSAAAAAVTWRWVEQPAIRWAARVSRPAPPPGQLAHTNPGVGA